MKDKLPACIVLLFGLFCGQNLYSQSNKIVDSSAIQSQFSKFQQCLLMRDTILIGDFYTEDAISLRQNEPVRRSRGSILQRWKKSLSNPIVVKVTASELNVSSSGQDAFQFGVFEVYSADLGNMLLASGKIMFIWKKQRDGWKIAVEMDNFNSAKPVKSEGQTKQ